MTSVTGYTGSGYADTDRGIGKSISWQFHVAAGGTYSFVWRYGNGGTVAPRNATLLIDGKVVRDTIFFPHTGTWTNWTFSAPVEVTLADGDHKVRIEAHSTDGLGNYDYFKVLGSGMTAVQCLPSFVLSVKSNNEDWGTVSYEPDLKYYDQGTSVTLRARAKPGYFFESWTGEETSADSMFTFQLKGNVNAVARFLPNGTTRDSSIAGYATVQDDRGTPYLVTGGALGQKVDARSIADLHTYLESPNPYVVQFSGELTGTDVINVTSDKTLLGVGDKAHLMGIELSINEARNVIIRNVAISHVTPQDAVEINGKSKNIVIDHCEFFSDRDHGEDFYDGLLDIKNESSFITVSWTRFHDHYKTCLISSGDQQVADSVIRITFHHNYFYNCGSRLPSIRFGKAHIFNNYYRDCGTAVNSRMGAWVRVERNYFERVGTAVMMEFSSITGRVQLIENEFGTSAVTTTPTCDLHVPYAYQHLLDSTMALPAIISAGTRTMTSIEVNEPSPSFRLMVFPNPFNPLTTIRYALPVRSTVTIVVRDVLGKQVAVLVNEEKPPGLYEVSFSGENAASGVYFVTMRAGSFIETRRMVLLK
jgi:pectate lyase